jgi:hypothetical protein
MAAFTFGLDFSEHEMSALGTFAPFLEILTALLPVKNSKP